MNNNHYDVITKMPGFFARKRYYHTCKKAYDHHEDHLCPNLCKCCRFPDCPVVSWVYCNHCKRLFKSQTCFDRHKHSVSDELSICESLVKCTQCDKVFKRYKEKPESHHCGLRKCSTCGKYVLPQYVLPSFATCNQRRRRRRKLKQLLPMRMKTYPKTDTTFRHFSTRNTGRASVNLAKTRKFRFCVSTRKWHVRAQFMYRAKRSRRRMGFSMRQDAKRFL